MAIKSWPAKTPRHFIAASIFFMIVVALTFGVYLYKASVESKNDNAISETRELQQTIAKLRKDEDIQAYELYDKNSKKLDTMTYLSKVPTFYSETLRLWRTYNLDLKIFHIQNEK